MARFLPVLLAFCCGWAEAAGERFFLPTDNGAVQDPVHYLQNVGTVRGNGGFGMVREQGTRFHGGIDIRPLRRRPDGEPADAVRSVADGTVVYVNRNPKMSSYGVYVLVEHDGLSLPLLSLYGHLATVREEIVSGRRLSAGDPLGTMGRTAADYVIKKEQAHLHFELALRLGEEEKFSRWYLLQRFPTANCHGQWNGLNLVSLDPLPLLRTIGEFSLAEHVRRLPTAFETRIRTGQLPPFLRRYGALWDGNTDEPGGDFLVEWTWFGLPKRWRPLPPSDLGMATATEVTLLRWDPGWLASASARGTLQRGRNGFVRLGERTLDTLEKIFGDSVKTLDSPAVNFSNGGGIGR
ncbi:MAG: M23 family metallopeptidase [Puniceicoccales bacterium]|jgi:hypothetical protein|nr:M23 family metallopeptidase [Puniceicoccales bacterium]